MAQSWRTAIKRLIRCDNSYIRCFLAEFFGTLVLVMLLDSMIANATFHAMLPGGGRKPGHDQLYLAVGAGLAVMIGVLISGGVSGGHLNPALSVAFALFGRLSWKKCLVYLVAQYVGALFAAAIIFGVYHDTLDLYDGGNRSVTGPTATAGIFSTYPVGEHLAWWSAFFDQILATAVLAFGILAIVDEKNWNIPRGSVPIYIGMLISSIVLSLGYNTGVAINPARDSMPRLFTYLAGWGQETFSYWNYTWFFVPVLGPHIGAVFGATLYQVFIGAHWPEERVAVVVDTYKPTLGLNMDELRTPLNSPAEDYLHNGKTDRNRNKSHA
ncbi:putative Aquaporin-10 [Hypsibius exemplaris]|uniref:Aquaporin-3 n=1 Tax=Hypsibius exemplaris TaxID=2072580 RepID=A0A1W0X8I2_HYPEX|nr:putative Aquaporin-10 [Hypsibius exemplaris]